MTQSLPALAIDQRSAQQGMSAVEFAWRSGNLSWKLDAHQLRVYKQYREWEQTAGKTAESGALPRLFVMDISRRWGKTYLCLVIKIEDCLRQRGSVHTYSCAFAKDIRDIVLPITDEICSDVPDDLRPAAKQSHEGRSMGVYFQRGIGSVIRLVGIDKNPNGLRGRFSDGFVIGEAGYVKRLDHTVRNVIYPQFQRRPQARMILESNSPEDLDHDFDKFIPDAKRRGAYTFATIDDNTALSDTERAEFIAAAGGKDSATCQREYYGARTRDHVRAVVPEFASRHVVRSPVPQYARAFEALDPGTSDLFGAVFGYWDYDRKKLVIQRSWAESNANTSKVVRAINEIESELWLGEPSMGDEDEDLGEEPRRAPLKYWDGRALQQNPYMRVSDTDARFIIDINSEHGLRVLPTAKDGAMAAIQSLRVGIQNDRVEIWPNSGPLEDHINHARWNDAHTEWVRHRHYGHFDCLAALVILWRNTRLNDVSPAPSAGHGLDSRDAHVPREFRSRLTLAGQSLQRVLSKPRDPNGWKRRRGSQAWRQHG